MAKKIQNKTGAFLATGRRKKSIARVRLYPGKGEFTINNRGVEEYLQRDTLILIAKQPLTLTGLLTRDPRMKERKKYGLKKARKAPQFSKR